MSRLEQALGQSEQHVSELSQALAVSEEQVAQLQALSQSQSEEMRQLHEVCTQLSGVQEMNEVRPQTVFVIWAFALTCQSTGAGFEV